MNRRAMGAMGEARAAKALEDMGYAILAKNYRKRSGEIDLIAMQGDTLAFIEVKARTTARYGQPAEAVTPLKQRRIAETAMAYIAENGLLCGREAEVMALIRSRGQFIPRPEAEVDPSFKQIIPYVSILRGDEV
ncbi:MAG: YraN family protein, partial [Clostridiales bacterium]|nr:YraN family protein [Clostridiales bacterium]